MQSFFLFSVPSLSEVSKVVLVSRWWGAALDSSTLTTNANTDSLLLIQKVDPIIRWELARKIVGQQVVFLTVSLGPGIGHLTVYERRLLIKKVEEVNACIRDQYR